MRYFCRTKQTLYKNRRTCTTQQNSKEMNTYLHDHIIFIYSTCSMYTVMMLIITNSTSTKSKPTLLLLTMQKTGTSYYLRGNIN